MMQSPDTFYQNCVSLFNPAGYQDYAVSVRLAVVEFWVDVTPNMSLFRMLRDVALEHFGESGCSILPA
jgi:hypothetical protein